MNKRAGVNANTDTPVPSRQRAAASVDTENSKPSAEPNTGAVYNANADQAKPRRRKAGNLPSNRTLSPSVENSRAVPLKHTGEVSPEPQGAGERENAASTTPPADPTAETCWRLNELQKVRRFCIQSQQRNDRSMDSALARSLGYDPKADQATRKKIFALAGRIREAVEKGESVLRLVPFPLDDPRMESLNNFLPLIPISAYSRSAWDEQRELVEQEMKRIVVTLPVWPFVKEQGKGVGELGLARIVGEAPRIYQYETPYKLWKRLGLAVIDGERQNRRSSKEDALIHGYNPSRRAEAWSVLSDVMLRAQWRGAKKDDPDSEGYPIGPYGAVYGRRKALTLQRIEPNEHLPFGHPDRWHKKRCDDDARRVMAKEFLRDLWLVWHGHEPRHPRRFNGPIDRLDVGGGAAAAEMQDEREATEMQDAA
jgi:hypothetical protein